MFIPVRRLLRETEPPFVQSGELDFSQEDFLGHTIPAPVNYAIVAAPAKGAVHIETEISAVAEAFCARCLTPLKEKLAVKQQYLIREADLTDEDAELPFTKEGMLDVREFIYQELMLGISPVALCSENCPGLCAECGKIKGVCGCAPSQEGDPRLQVLRSLLQQDEEV